MDGYLNMMEDFKSVSTNPKAHIDTNQLSTVRFDVKFSLPLEIHFPDVHNGKKTSDCRKRNYKQLKRLRHFHVSSLYEIDHLEFSQKINVHVSCAYSSHRARVAEEVLHQTTSQNLR